jgi:ATP-dependent DNA ligase
VLDEIFDKIRKKAAPLGLTETLDGTPADLVRVTKEFGFEGILAKCADSFYESGKRNGAWLKYRVNQGQEFVIGGYVPNNPLDSIIVGYYDGDKLVYMAKGSETASSRTLGARSSQTPRAMNRHLPFRKPAGKETHDVFADQRRNEEMHLAQA